jgi:hypothetical protein
MYEIAVIVNQLEKQDRSNNTNGMSQRVVTLCDFGQKVYQHLQERDNHNE